MRINNKGLSGIFVSLLSTFVLWSFLFTMTKTSWSSYIYVFLVVFCLLISLLVVKYRPTQVNVKLCIWMPFIILSVVGNFRLGNYEGLLYNIISFALLLLACYIDWADFFPERILTVSGVIMIIGILFQIIFSPIYNTYIATFFKNTNDILYWSNGYGFAGFTYQLGVTAIILIYFESVVLYNDFKNQKTKIILLIFIVICIFLTGKRAVALLAVLLPIMVLLLGKCVTSKRAFNILAIMSIVGVLVYFFISNAELFIDSKILGRFANTIIDMESGRDFSSHRSILYSDAIRLFNNNKVFGIGLGQYKELSQFGTDVHNTYLQVLCEMGLVGFVCYLLPLVVNVYECIKRNRIEDNKYLKISLFFQLFYIIYGFTGNVSVNEFCYIFYYFAISMVINVRENGETNQ